MVTKEKIAEMLRLARSVKEGKPLNPSSFVQAGQVLADFVVSYFEAETSRIAALEAFVRRCAEGDHPDEIPDEAAVLLGVIRR